MPTLVFRCEMTMKVIIENETVESAFTALHELEPELILKLAQDLEIGFELIGDYDPITYSIKE